MLVVRRNNSSNWLNDWLDNTLFNTEATPQVRTTAPAINVKETCEEYIMEVAVPGLKKEWVRINLTNEGLLHMAIEREKTLQADHPIMAAFWEMYEYLEGDHDDNSDTRVLNHSRDDGLIAINLNHMKEVAADRRQDMPDITELKKLLPTSRRHKCIDINRTVNSAINAQFNARSSGQKRSTTVKCWVFEAKRSA